MSDVLCHLRQCNDSFIPPLDTRLNLEQYAQKLADHSVTFEAWDADELVGLVAAYFNDPTKRQGFITSVSIAESHRRRGISRVLMQHCVEYGKVHGFGEIELEVTRQSAAAIKLYELHGFTPVSTRADTLIMKRMYRAESPVKGRQI